MDDRLFEVCFFVSIERPDREPAAKRLEFFVQFIAVKVVQSGWWPAKRFWNVFQVHDPAGLSPVVVRSETTTSRFLADAGALRDAEPGSLACLGEKVKAAAVLGLCRALHGQIRGGDVEGADMLRGQIVRTMGLNPQQLLAMFPHFRWLALAKENIVDETNDPQRNLLGQAVVLAGAAWFEALRRDYDRLNDLSEYIVE